MRQLIRCSPLQYTLVSPVVGLVEEALEQHLWITMAIDRDAQHLTLHPAIEAIRETVGLRRTRLGRAVLHLQLAASRLEAIGG